jgi:hypothetical protein
MRTILKALTIAAPLLTSAALQLLASIGYATSNPALSTLCLCAAICTAVFGLAGGFVEAAGIDFNPRGVVKAVAIVLALLVVVAIVALAAGLLLYTGWNM